MNLTLKCITFSVSLGKTLQWFGLFFFFIFYTGHRLCSDRCISYSTEKESGIEVELRIPYLPV